MDRPAEEQSLVSLLLDLDFEDKETSRTDVSSSSWTTLSTSPDEACYFTDMTWEKMLPDSRVALQSPEVPEEEEEKISAEDLQLLEFWKDTTAKIFEKEFVLKDSTVPSDIPQFFREPSWRYRSCEFLTLKADLNRAKTKALHSNAYTWDTHCRILDPSKFVQLLLHFQYGVEFCSEDFCKIYECLSKNEDIFLKSKMAAKTEFNSVHLSECPGGFVAGLNHFLRTNRKDLEWKWLATGLNPHHERNEFTTAVDDRLINAQFRNWTFLANNTGNLLNSRNMEFLINEAVQRFGFDGVHLITANGANLTRGPGFARTTLDDEDQENVNCQLQFAEIVTAISIMGIGGSFILRMFTFFETSTICNLYLLSCVFKKVKFFKPATSIEGKSELYLICTGFVGKPPNLKQLLKAATDFRSPMNYNGRGASLSLFSQEDIPSAFLENLNKAGQFLNGLQAKIIERSWQTFKYHTWIYDPIKELQLKIAEDWMTNHNFQKMNSFLGLLEERDRGIESEFPAYHVHNEIRKFEHYFELTLENIEDEIKGRLKLFRNLIKPALYLKVAVKHRFKYTRVKYGQPFTDINSSGFCDSLLISWRRQIKGLAVANRRRIGLLDTKSCGNETCDLMETRMKLKSLAAAFSGYDKRWVLHLHCCHENLRNLANWSDAENARLEFLAINISLRKLQSRDSLFLCEYPLLTRMQVGFLFGLSAHFENTTICYHKEKNIQGIFLYGFKGPRYQFFEDLDYIMSSVDDQSKPHQMALECMPPHYILSSSYPNALKAYNIINLCRRFTINTRILHSLCPDTRND